MSTTTRSIAGGGDDNWVTYYAIYMSMATRGAIDDETKVYVLPDRASKGRSYSCADCNQRVILRSGEVRVAHFAHYTPTTKCKFYDTTAGESDSHRHAKLLLQKWIREKKPITLLWECSNQGKFGSCGTMVEETVQYQDGDEVVLEYRDPAGKYIADLAILNNDKVRCIFEINHSHRTTTSRPEPWFEVNASAIDEGSHYGEETIYIDNIRMHNTQFCSNCRVKQEHWVTSIPILSKRYGQERMWKQDVPCIACGTMSYSPEWVHNRPRQVCKLCIGTDSTRVRQAVNTMIWG